MLCFVVILLFLVSWFVAPLSHSVCVCVSETDRQTDRDWDREIQRQTDRYRHTWIEKDSDRERYNIFSQGPHTPLLNRDVASFPTSISHVLLWTAKWRETQRDRKLEKEAERERERSLFTAMAEYWDLLHACPHPVLTYCYSCNTDNKVERDRDRDRESIQLQLICNRMSLQTKSDYGWIIFYFRARKLTIYVLFRTPGCVWLQTVLCGAVKEGRKTGRREGRKERGRQKGVFWFVPRV